MHIALRGSPFHRAVIFTSRFDVSKSLQTSRSLAQKPAINGAINTTISMDANINEPGNEGERPSTSGNQRRRPKINTPKEPRPDHFLALRLSHDPTVISTITTIQNAIAKHSPHLQPSFIDPISAHLTLGVLHLPDDATKEAAQAALLDAATAVAAVLDTPCCVSLCGIGNFRSQVIFLDLADGNGGSGSGGNTGGREAALQLAATVRTHFQEQGLLLQANRAFVPHVTIAKISKMQPWTNNYKSRRKKTQAEVEAEQLTIPTESYSALSSISSGAVRLSEIQLCAMEGRQPGEYYKVLASATFTN
jgi:2'-5' RNA ligase